MVKWVFHYVNLNARKAINNVSNLLHLDEFLGLFFYSCEESYEKKHRSQSIKQHFLIV